MKKIIFVRIADMKYYKGITANDRPVNGGSYVKETGDACEAYNFKSEPFEKGDFCLGFFQRIGNSKNKPIQMHIENIPGCKGLKKENEVEDVIVVFCSKAPGKEGMTVVGFYKNAVAYRFEQFMPFDNGYEQPFSFLAKEEDCVLIPYNKRHKDLRWRVPQSGKCGMTFGFGRSNVWYAGSDPENEEETSYVERMIKNIENYEN
jgi:hypothetical protein